MKTKPDDITLTQWMDGELKGEELSRVEAWVQDHPELLAERDAVQAMSASIREHVAGSEEPPYPDFFNQRILRAIEEERELAVSKANKEEGRGVRGFWQWLSAPVAIPMAMAAMAICFYLGTQVGTERELVFGGAVAAVSEASVYTPDGEVHAKVFDSSDAEATVIVLEGLEDLPDELEMAGGPSVKRSGAVMVSTDGADGVYYY